MCRNLENNESTVILQESEDSMKSDNDKSRLKFKLDSTSHFFFNRIPMFLVEIP